jgi:hypothetical protein
VQEVCLHGEGRGLGEELADLETGLQAIESSQENRKYRGRV